MHGVEAHARHPAHSTNTHRHCRRHESAPCGTPRREDVHPYPPQMYCAFSSWTASQLKDMELRTRNAELDVEDMRGASQKEAALVAPASVHACICDVSSVREQSRAISRYGALNALMSRAGSG